MDIIMQTAKIYNNGYIKRRRNESGCLERCYELAVSEDRAEVVWVDRNVINTSFS